jgi:hypothetical protein
MLELAQECGGGFLDFMKSTENCRKNVFPSQNIGVMGIKRRRILHKFIKN